MTRRDRRNATEDAERDLAVHCGRFCTRARQEADASMTERLEPVAFDPGVADEVARIMGRLSMPVSAII